jgi:hypothetical protein
MDWLFDAMAKGFAKGIGFAIIGIIIWGAIALYKKFK